MGNAITGTAALNLSLSEFQAAVENQAKPLIIPLCLEVPLPPISPLDVYAELRGEHGFILESIEGSEKIAQYSFVGINPHLTVSFSNTVTMEGSEPFISIAASPEGATPVDKIKSILQRFNFVNLKAPRFFGGMVGYFSYDIVQSLFNTVGLIEKDDSGFPLAQFMLSKDCIVFDHLRGKLFIFSSPFLTYDSDTGSEYEKSRENILHIYGRILGMESDNPCSPCNPAREIGDVKSNISQKEYLEAVSRIKEHIFAGDIFQAVLSRRIECPFSADPLRLYRELRRINPSPYMYFLDFGDVRIIGSSPEMLVRVEKGKVTTVPIAGTRLRGQTPDEDRQLARELLADEKERAEHAMLVDMARNDIGRVCKFGTVAVTDFMGIEKFSHVQHIVSTVQGVLRDNLDCYEAFKSCFPAGTVSGAPKIRAMQIIEEVEKDRRGIYAGAVGYVGFDRNLEFAITIRTIVTLGSTAYIQVGAGIVADSVPEREWDETENKGKAMIAAIAAAGGE